MVKKLLELFLTFFKIGAFTFGGGYAMIPVIEDICVEKKQWITHEDMVNVTVIAESTPGPIAINCATFVGFKQAKFWGAVAATLGVVLPSFIIVLAICKAYDRFKDNYMFKGIMTGLRPAVLGLIGTAALGLATPDNFIDWKSYVLCLAAFAGLYFKKIGPFSAIGLGALAGLILY